MLNIDCFKKKIAANLFVEKKKLFRERKFGNVSMKFEKHITSAVKRCFFSVEPRVIFNTRQLLPATKKDMLPSHHHSNVFYQFLYHCDSRYVSRTSQRLEEQIKQHVPRSIAQSSCLTQPSKSFSLLQNQHTPTTILRIRHWSTSS